MTHSCRSKERLTREQFDRVRAQFDRVRAQIDRVRAQIDECWPKNLPRPILLEAYEVVKL